MTIEELISAAAAEAAAILSAEPDERIERIARVQVRALTRLVDPDTPENADAVIVAAAR